MTWQRGEERERARARMQAPVGDEMTTEEAFAADPAAAVANASASFVVDDEPGSGAAPPLPPAEPHAGQVKAEGGKRKRQGLKVPRWTPVEEDRLRRTVEEVGERNWPLVAQRLGNRSAMGAEQHWQIMVGKRKRFSKAGTIAEKQDAGSTTPLGHTPVGGLLLPATIVTSSSVVLTSSAVGSIVESAGLSDAPTRALPLTPTAPPLEPLALFASSPAELASEP